MSELVRANKVTAYFSGDNIITGTFYRTHNKLQVVKSNDESVVGAGFVIPENVESPAQKLEAFKTFLQVNASTFGIAYDPVDRRPDDFKFPNRYDEAAFTEYSKTMLSNTLSNIVESVQSNVIDKMVKAGHMVEGSTISCNIGDGIVSVTEAYKTGSLKYGTATYPVTIDVNGISTEVNVDIELVSGQLKKPRTFGDSVMTMTGMKTVLVDAGLLPKIEKPAKEEDNGDTANAECAEVLPEACNE